MFKFLLLLLLLTTNVYAQNVEEVKTSNITDDGSLGILDEKGHKIVSQYVEVCRNTKTGSFVRCPKEGENGGLIKSSIERRCRGENGKFIKCPKK